MQITDILAQMGGLESWPGAGRQRESGRERRGDS